jgi:predicted nuclease of predicted toxin-antitoxin system
VKLWIDAQLSPALASWINLQFDGIEASAVRDLGFRDAEDEEIFRAARQADAIVMSKDSDFVDLLWRLGPPPQILWITCGNTSNAQMRAILSGALAQAIVLFRQGEWLVEISGS